jgi:branched-subunit amino acid aminotransferase/4-amino-4-deoxychorismate lyase
VSTGPRHVWVDGEVLPADARHLSVFDRGFQLGDGVFETLRASGGRVTELAQHVTRLHRSAAGLEIALPADLDQLLAAGIVALLAAEGLDGPDADASIRSGSPCRVESTESVACCRMTRTPLPRSSSRHGRWSRPRRRT